MLRGWRGSAQDRKYYPEGGGDRGAITEHLQPKLFVELWETPGLIFGIISEHCCCTVIMHTHKNAIQTSWLAKLKQIQSHWEKNSTSSNHVISQMMLRKGTKPNELVNNRKLETLPQKTLSCPQNQWTVFTRDICPLVFFSFFSMSVWTHQILIYM